MKPSSKRLIAIAILLILILSAYLVVTAPQPTDTDIIDSQLESARAAASRRDINGILHSVSADYHDDAVGNVDKLHAMLIQVMRNAGPIHVDKITPKTRINGDNADSVCHVVIRNGQNDQIYFQGDITLHWKKEESTRLLVIPSHTWRVVKADYPGSIFGGDY